MAHERCAEEDAEAILSNLKMDGRCSSTEIVRVFVSTSLRSRHLSSAQQIRSNLQVTPSKLGREFEASCIRMHERSFHVSSPCRGTFGSQGFQQQII